MHRQYKQFDNSYLVPGSTAGSSSPGFLNYNAGFPAPISFGTNEPQLMLNKTKQQILPQETYPIEKILLDMQLQYNTTVFDDKRYTQGYLRTLIGKLLKFEFLFGESLFMDRIGTLTTVGIDYIILREIETDDDLLCDALAIKFVMEYK